MEKNSERVDHSYQVIIQTNLLEQNLLNAEASQKAYLLSTNSEFLESYVSELKDIPLILSNLSRLTADNYRQQKNLDTLTDIINRQLNILKTNMTGDADSIPTDRFRQYSDYMGRIRDIIGSIRNNEEYLLNERNTDKTRNTSESRRTSFLSLVIAFAVCGIASVTIIWFFNRNENYRSQLEDKLLKLTRLNGEIRELTMASAHNLQEPMRKMQMIIDWMQHVHGIDPGLNDQLNRIKEIYSRQQLINNKIVDYYDILLKTDGKEPVDLQALILGLQAKHEWSHAFSLRLEALPAIAGNRAQLELLFTSLIQNAMQFSHPGRPLQVRIYEETDVEKREASAKDYYCLVVSDNGTGIPEEYHSKIFDLFQKLETSRDGSVQSGMGLSFCRRILLNHEGWISVRKNEPEGLSILLFFPKSQ